MKKITIVWILTIVMLFSCLLIIGLNKNKETKLYIALENDLVEAAKIYYGQDINLKKLPQKKQTVSITIDELKQYGIKINNKINEDYCDGKVEVTGKSISYIYKAVIKCNKYETK